MAELRPLGRRACRAGCQVEALGLTWPENSVCVLDRQASKGFVRFVSESSSDMSEMCRLPHFQILEKSQQPQEALRLDSARTSCRCWQFPQCQAMGAPPSDGAQSRGTRPRHPQPCWHVCLLTPETLSISTDPLAPRAETKTGYPSPPFLLEAGLTPCLLSPEVGFLRGNS